jgi:hypothetical protein
MPYRRCSAFTLLPPSSCVSCAGPLTCVRADVMAARCAGGHILYYLTPSAGYQDAGRDGKTVVSGWCGEAWRVHAVVYGGASLLVTLQPGRSGPRVPARQNVGGTAIWNGLGSVGGVHLHAHWCLQMRSFTALSVRARYAAWAVLDMCGVSSWTASSTKGSGRATLSNWA